MIQKDDDKSSKLQLRVHVYRLHDSHTKVEVSPSILATWFPLVWRKLNLSFSRGAIVLCDQTPEAQNQVSTVVILSDLPLHTLLIFESLALLFHQVSMVDEWSNLIFDTIWPLKLMDVLIQPLHSLLKMM